MMAGSMLADREPSSIPAACLQSGHSGEARTTCGQTLPNRPASLGSAQVTGGCAALHLSLLTGGAAYGMPGNETAVDCLQQMALERSVPSDEQLRPPSFVP